MQAVAKTTLVPRVRKYVAAAEICMVFALIMLYSWLWPVEGPTRLEQFILGGLVSLIIGVGWCVRNETFQDIGLVNTFLGRLALTALAARITLWRFVPQKFIFVELLGWFIWAIWQQTAINGFFAKRLQDFGIPKVATALMVGTIFMIIHIPNPVLMPASFFGASLSSYIFLSEPKKKIWYLITKNMYFAGAVHLFVDCMIKNHIPIALHHGLNVARAYLNWKPG